MCCNQVRSIIVYVNTRKKIRILSSHCENKTHYCNTITSSYKAVTLSTQVLSEIVQLGKFGWMEMPKQAKLTTAKVRKIYRQYPNEFGETPVGDLRCNFCDVLVKCDKRFFVESHRKSKLYQSKMAITSSSQGKQTYIQ